MSKSDEESKMFMQLMEIDMNNYLKKKLKEIDSKAHQTSKVSACMSLKDYYERFCARKDNPTFNMIEVDLKR
jgi:hypothetical protein